MMEMTKVDLTWLDKIRLWPNSIKLSKQTMKQNAKAVAIAATSTPPGRIKNCQVLQQWLNSCECPLSSNELKHYAAFLFHFFYLESIHIHRQSVQQLSLSFWYGWFCQDCRKSCRAFQRAGRPKSGSGSAREHAQSKAANCNLPTVVGISKLPSSQWILNKENFRRIPLKSSVQRRKVSDSWWRSCKWPSGKITSPGDFGDFGPSSEVLESRTSNNRNPRNPDNISSCWFDASW